MTHLRFVFVRAGAPRLVYAIAVRGSATLPQLQAITPSRFLPSLGYGSSNSTLTRKNRRTRNPSERGGRAMKTLHGTAWALLTLTLAVRSVASPEKERELTSEEQKEVARLRED